MCSFDVVFEGSRLDVVRVAQTALYAPQIGRIKFRCHLAYFQGRETWILQLRENLESQYFLC